MARNRRENDAVLRSVLSFTFGHWRRQRWMAAGLGVTVCLATIAEIFAPLYAGKMIDAMARGPGAASEAISAFVAMTALGLMTLGLRHLAWWGVVPFTLRMMRDVAEESFARVQRFSSNWHGNSFSGSVVRKITRGMWALDSLNDVLLMFLLPSLAVLIGAVALFSWRWPMIGMLMGVGAAIYIATTVVLAVRVIAPVARLSNAWDTRMGGVLADAVGANAVVKAFGAEHREDARLSHVVGKWQRRTRRTWMRVTWIGTGQMAMLWLLRAVVTGGALWMWWSGRATPGDVTYVLTTYFLLNGYLRDIGQHVNQFQRAVNEMEELVHLHGLKAEVADIPGAPSLAVPHGEIRVEHVDFRYGDHVTPLYSDLSVTIAAGERVGLVGRSGSGKTTFVKLIQRLHDVTGGRILIDGQNVAEVTQQSLRARIAIVQQEPILFHRSIAENIAYGRPGASMAAIEKAAEQANAHNFINQLPRGYATLVGERGVKLSGGERQRVAIARAFLADAPILILDEATSSLDSESEALIQQAMERLMQGRTSLVIAHRLSTVREMDRILVFDHGAIVEQGRHEDLIVRPGGIYRSLFERQTGAPASAQIASQ